MTTELPLVQTHPHKPINKAYDGVLKLVIGDILSTQQSNDKIEYRGVTHTLIIDRLTGCPVALYGSSDHARGVFFNKDKVVSQVLTSKVTGQIEVRYKRTYTKSSVQTDFLVLDGGLVKEHLVYTGGGDVEEIETHLTLVEYLGARFVLKDLVRNRVLRSTFIINDKDKEKSKYNYTLIIPRYIDEYGYLKVVHMSDRYVTCYSSEKNCYFINNELYLPDHANAFFTNRILMYKNNGEDQSTIDEAEQHLGCLLNYLN